MTEREIFISLVDNDKIAKSDVIILLEGDGYNRCETAIKLYQNKFADKILFSGGVSNHSNGSFEFNLIHPLLIKKGVNEFDIIYENESKNTLEQAINVLKIAKDQMWEKLILVASNYHQYRAYLTFLKIIQLENLDILIYNFPARDLSWFEINPWGTRYDLLIDEFEKINQYSKKGHLATFQDAIKYQIWKEKYQ